ncbi:transcriptional repressor [Rubellicoccus peritrichatus]|uniref:Transcriptional repressor n=1 Tax=Rubellicoccus peritrichatus TaxID=3080537 RepID=A0AAQ3QUF1_9BACT|nr:transcriptional repressor [Puniceicoccus sp. CR14]WOO39870.1 transcriptional repressor [Puniceicoccus sp. CR14]
MPKPTRQTRQRAAIRETLLQHNNPLNPKQIHRLASESHPNLGIATVYRNLSKMLEDGEIESVHLPGQMPHYTYPRQKKHALLFCSESKEVQVLDTEEINIELPDIPDHFECDGYEVVLHGRLKKAITAK